jgi:hypothetical protein
MHFRCMFYIYMTYNNLKCTVHVLHIAKVMDILKELQKAEDKPQFPKDLILLASCKKF